MTISGLTFRCLLLGTALGAAALAPLPAAAQYGGGGYGGGGYGGGGYGGGGYHQDDYDNDYRPRYRQYCYDRVVRVYDEYYGGYVKRRQRVCERRRY